MRFDQPPVLGQHVARARNADRQNRNLAELGQSKGTGLEAPDRVARRARAFRKDQDRGAGPQMLGRVVERGARGAVVATADQNVPPSPQRGAQKRNARQLFLGHELRQLRQRSKQRRNIHVARVVGNDHVRAIGAHVLGALHLELDATQLEQPARPTALPAIKQHRIARDQARTQPHRDGQRRPQREHEGIEQGSQPGKHGAHPITRSGRDQAWAARTDAGRARLPRLDRFQLRPDGALVPFGGG